MAVNKTYDAIIIGGSFAGLSAGLVLGRSRRHVLIIDSGKPCNRQTPHSHNFLTQDGKTPQQISESAKTDVAKYPTVQFKEGLAVSGKLTQAGFDINLDSGETFSAKKLLFATGVKDEMPPLKGFTECWGISVLHCPFCHGYEVKDEQIGLFGNGAIGFEFVTLISNWSKNLTLFTNGKSELTPEQTEILKAKGFRVVETEPAEIVHENGYVKHLLLKDGTIEKLTAIFARVPFKQHSDIPAALGCELTEQGFLKADEFGKTTVPGIFAAGDNTTPMRAVSMAVAAGMKAGVMLHKELMDAGL